MISELGKISEWLKVNKLSLNVKKTHYIVFSGGKRPPNALDIKIDNQEISRVLKTKFLGVVVDSKLSWKEHIAYITGKIARGIGLISKARRYLNRDSLLSLYYYFIYPYLIYCNHVWGAAAKTHTRTLCTLHKCVVRIISGVKPRTYSDHLFKELNLLKFQDINTYLIGNLMFRVYNDDLVTFETWFEKSNSFHDYNTRQKDQYHIPSLKTKLGQSSLRFSGGYGYPFINLALQKKPANFPSQRRSNNLFYWEYFEMVITFLEDILFPSFPIHFQRCGKHVLFKVATLAPYPNSVISFAYQPRSP